MRILHEIAIFQTVKSKVIISLFETVRLSVSISPRNLYISLNGIKESGMLFLRLDDIYCGPSASASEKSSRKRRNILKFPICLMI